ncbi:MAG: Flp pilus assembly protein CpaB [Sphingomonadales bacterium]|nr:Flp pilus assembly protein CpaB [Sphingomonadales bacterium]
MDKKKLTLLLVALVIAVGTALGARSLFVGAAAPQAAAAAAPVLKGPKVLVAQRALPVGTIITADSIAFQAWPKDMVQDAYFLDGEADMTKLLGTVVRYPVTAGQPLTQGALVAPGDRGFLAAALGPGMRAITIPVSAKTGVAGFVFPGDHVDLVLTQQVKGADNASLKASETILKNLRVLATDQSTTTETVEGKSVVRTSSTVTLEVTPRIAEKVTVAETIGQLSLSLRSLADNQSELDKMVASGAVKLPEGATKADEDRILSQAANRPIEGPTTFQTGGDVSRFQRNTVPESRDAMMAKLAAASNYARSNNNSMGAPMAPIGPTIRVTRGKTTTVEPVGRN